MRSTRLSEKLQPATAATSSRTTLAASRAGVGSNGIRRRGSAASRRERSGRRRAAAANRVTSTAWSDHAGEQRAARVRPIAFRIAVERGALDGDEGEEQRDDHDRDDHGHADDLRERGLLLGHAGQGVDGLRLGSG